jgi:hypothetical protein
MTKLQCLFPVIFIALAGLGGDAAGQTYLSKIENPIVRYKMTARLDPATQTVAGHYTLRWRNHTTDSVPDLYFHLYLNAFKNADSTWMRERNLSRRREALKSWRADPEEKKWGWVDVNRIQIVDGADLTPAQSFVQPDDGNTFDQTVMRVELPEPVPPFGSIELAVDFTSRLPRGLARTGYVDDYFFIVQWFPKIGVYEGPGDRGRTSGGWNCHQFHANTEFYADYGSYDVELTIPSNYKVGATGFLHNERRNADGTTTYNFFQEDVHDFAWTASPRFIQLTRTFDWGKEVRGDDVVAWSRILNLPAEQVALRDVSVTLLLQPDHRRLEERYFRAVFNALKYFGLWYGKYPYDTLTLVDPARNSNSGGMEYPTLITGGTYFLHGARAMDPELVTVHEFGHQFWYALVGNNEFEEAFLDEGFNTYSTGKVMDVAYPNRCVYRYPFGLPVMVYPWLTVAAPSFPFAGVGGIPLGEYFSCTAYRDASGRRQGYLGHAEDDAIARHGWQYLEGASYGVNSYARTALTLDTLENYLGTETMARVMRTYHQRWRYRHPTLNDFIATVNEVSGRDMDWFFQQFFYGANRVDYAVTEITKEPMGDKIGIYDEGGVKKFYSAESAGEAGKGKVRPERSIVIVRRLGGVSAPVDVLVRFEDGQEVREQWDGQYRWAKFAYDKAVKSAEVDPDRKLALEANLTNNSRIVNEDNRAAAKWYLRWIFWVENLFLAASFFS